MTDEAEPEKVARGRLIYEIATLLEDMPHYTIGGPIDYEGGRCGGLYYVLEKPQLLPTCTDGIRLVDLKDLDNARLIVGCRSLLERSLALLGDRPYVPYVPSTGVLVRTDELDAEFLIPAGGIVDQTDKGLGLELHGCQMVPLPGRRMCRRARLLGGGYTGWVWDDALRIDLTAAVPWLQRRWAELEEEARDTQTVAMPPVAAASKDATLRSSMGVVRKMTTDEYQEAVDSYLGYCLNCGEERDSTEGDAERYHCDGCEKDAVYGVEILLVMGKIKIVEDEESNDRDVPSEG